VAEKLDWKGLKIKKSVGNRKIIGNGLYGSILYVNYTRSCSVYTVRVDMCSVSAGFGILLG
jgi:hypothetical protein